MVKDARQRTSINIDARLWRRFKATLALQGKDMSPVLEEFLRGYLDEHEATARAEANHTEEEPDNGTL
jgi:metal-responsive CopG/Arc/MetJ family transcriptional regulator